MTFRISFPEFKPHPLVRGPHAQTIVGRYLTGTRFPYVATRHHVVLEDGDRIVLHDDRPACWRERQRVVVLVHGLGGCHSSAYMGRVAGKLAQQGLRVFRLDLRGCGAGYHLAQGTFHAGCSDDVAAVIPYLEQLCPHTRVTIVGFSLGANVVLKLASELGNDSLGKLDSAFAVAPPVDLLACARRMQRGLSRLYDKALVRWLIAYAHRRRQSVPKLAKIRLHPPPRTVWEFDDRITAPLGGFRDAEDYYRRSSAGPRLSAIRISTQILLAADDPLVPLDCFPRANLSPSTSVHVSRHGGHLGFVSAHGQDADRRWMDWRIVDWVRAQDAGSRCATQELP